MRVVAFWLVIAALMIILLILVVPLYYTDFLRSHSAAAVLVDLAAVAPRRGRLSLGILRLIRGRG